MIDMIDINGYEGLYAVTVTGEVYAYPKWRRKEGRYMKQRILANNTDRFRPHVQKTVCLYKEGKRHGKLVHRLVAEAFIPNPDAKPDINHIDGDSLNNNVENLEWATKSENMRHAQKTGLLTQDSTSQRLARHYAGLRSIKNLKNQ
jgi:hypothetical protein